MTFFDSKLPWAERAETWKESAMEKIVVKITEGELYVAAQTALMRQMDALRKDRKTDYGGWWEGWTSNVVGTVGEKAVAKHYNLYWSGAFGDLSAADVCGLQVRTSQQGWADLRINTDDTDSDIFVLVTLEDCLGGEKDCRILATLQGWAYAEEAKANPDWYREGKKGTTKRHWMPQSELHPMSELKHMKSGAGLS